MLNTLAKAATGIILTTAGTVLTKKAFDQARQKVNTPK